MNRAALLALSTALCAAPLAHAAPAAAPGKAAPAKAPRTPFGQPDLSGAWTNATLTPVVRDSRFGTQLVMPPDVVKALEGGMARMFAQDAKPTDIEATKVPPPKAPAVPVAPTSVYAAAGGDVGGYNAAWLDPGSQVMRVNGQPRTSLITTANGAPPPRKDGADATGGRRFGGLGSFDSYETRTLGERCIVGFGRNAGPPMLPNPFYNNDYQIVQTPDHVAIDVEMVHDMRIIRLNSTHRADGVRPWMGDSIGHWEGETLVVETTNLPQAQNFYGSWKELKVTERFTRLGPTRMLYQFEVEDPTMWDKPWGGEYEFSTLKGQVYEYACHEGNYALPGMLAGARRAEQEAAAAAAKPAPAESPGKAKGGKGGKGGA